MVIRGRARGNGQQLSKYLLFMNENEHIQILDVNGRPDPKDAHLHEALLSMSLTSELTKSDKGLYHAQINPAYGDDAKMDADKWLQAADMLGNELGFKEQRRVVVLHTKKGRTHAHVVWERFDLEKGRMISDSFSRLAQDRARKEMEKVFEHKQTPHRNVNRPEMKDLLSAIWQKTETGPEFIKEATKAGYVIAKGVQRRPFMVIDETGRSFDLVRQLDSIKTKDVRDRLKDEKLPLEKEAITTSKAQKSEKALDQVQENAIDKIMVVQEQRKVSEQERLLEQGLEFKQSKDDVIKPDEKAIKEAKRQERMKDFAAELERVRQVNEKEQQKTEETNKDIGQEKKITVANNFADNRPDIAQPLSEKELRKEKMRQAIKDVQERNERSRGKDYELD